MTAQRKASVVWQGNLTSGHGTVASDNGALGSLTVSFMDRLESESAITSPEELIAAAHAASFAMSLSNTLDANGKAPEQIEVQATCQLDRTTEGLEIRRIELKASARGRGLDEASLQELAEKAEQRCPVSRALTGKVEINLQASPLDVSP